MKRIVNTPGIANWGKQAVAVFALCAATTVTSSAQILTTLASFASGYGNGGLGSEMTLIQGTDGNFYGTTFFSGLNNGGTVFKITPTGTLTTLHSFCPQNDCTYGENPTAGLVQARDGNFYGTTFEGGTNGAGTVFKITPSGTLTTLYHFCSQTNCTDGGHPYAGLVQASDGNFYGTTNQGGTNGTGTVFKITHAGTLTTLYTFCSQTNCTDGSGPMGTLVQAIDGNLYGTTWAGGAVAGPCCGTVFKITLTGTLTTLVTVGGYPSGRLVQATDGNFYGTTARSGSVFKVTPGGMLTTLGYVGGFPYAGLVQATDGNFYGTTYVGGGNNNANQCQNNGCGSIFEITPVGMITTLYSFCSQTGCVDGVSPLAGLMQATNGSLYGTTTGGGTYGIGTVFSLNVGLGPFVETRPTSAKVGAIVTILGNNLKPVSKVAFNGTTAVFTVVSSSNITATVPNGATTGNVLVTAPRGTLSSNVAFRVTPSILSFSPTSGPVGTSVTITGDSLTGATRVTFGGIIAKKFTVDSYTQITATVPSGATTGKIRVTTPGGIATSTGTFTVN